MAVMLAAPSEGRRGILVLTHKEAKWLLGGEPRRPSGIVRGSLLRRLERSRDRYAIGVHSGRRLSANSAALDPRWDFVMATELLAPSLEPHRRIALSSAHFVPDGYGLPWSSARGWDLVHIATQSAGKQWSRFFEIVAELLDADPSLRVLGIATRRDEQPSLRAPAADILGQHLDRGFVLAEPVGGAFYKGWHPRVIERILADTKVLCLLSEVEGSSKVVSEASMAGCRVVLYEQLLACCVAVPAGTDHVVAMTPGTEAGVIQRTIVGFPAYRADRAVLAAFYGERASTVTLSRRLAQILGHPVLLDDADDLRFRLPAHSDTGMPWLARRPGDSTADVIGWRRMQALLAHLESVG